MESQSQNPQSSTGSSSSAQSSPATGTAGKSAPKAASRAENVGTEQVSGLNGLDSPEQARGKVEQLGQLNSQTGAAGKAYAALSSENTPVQARQGTAAEWQAALQSSLQKGWTAVASRVKSATPAQLALGAAAVGAAVWLSTRNRSRKAPSSRQQSAADRWLDYPTGADGSRNDGSYGQYNRPSGQVGSQYGSRYGSPDQPSQSPTAGQSQPTNGPASGPYGQSNETWLRPSDERWDD